MFIYLFAMSFATLLAVAGTGLFPAGLFFTIFAMAVLG